MRGEGKSFCSGVDVRELPRDHAVERDVDFLRSIQRRTKLILDAPKPVIAALKGAVLGGGLELALATDIRLAARDTRLGLPEVRFGLVTEALQAGVLEAVLPGQEDLDHLPYGRHRRAACSDNAIALFK